MPGVDLAGFLVRIGPGRILALGLGQQVLQGGQEIGAALATGDKIALAGFALGGPLGAMLGVYAGHRVDQARAEGGGPAGIGGGDQQSRQVAFTMAVIVLSAKMAKADGEVTRDEVDAFKRIFHIPPGETAQVGKIFDDARQDSAGFEPYAEQIAFMFAREPAVLEELLGGLFHIAMADGVMKPPELQYLRAVSAIFGFDNQRFERIRASFDGPEKSNPYDILGVTSDDSDDLIKKTYRNLVRENHPDKLLARGVPEEFIALATEKIATINEAYDEIAKERGI